MNKILITGASSAIGRKLISLIDKKNQIIIAHYNRSKNFLNFLKINKFKSKIILIKSDFSKRNDLNIFIKKIKRHDVDTIIHLVGKRLEIKRFEKTSFNNYLQEISVAFESIYEILKIFLPKMIKKNKGKIVFMLSSVTFDRPSAYMSPYVSLKYLLLGLVKSLSSEYKGANINFNSISPSMMDTPFLKNLDKKFIEINKQLNPSKKLLNINKVVKKIEFLISPNSNKIKGVNFLIKN